MICFILLCGYPPFYDENDQALFAQIKAGSFEFASPYWDEVSSGAKDLVSSLLVVDASARLTATQVLAHPWMTLHAAAGDVEEGARPTLSSAHERLTQFVAKSAKQKFRGGVKAVLASLRLARAVSLGSPTAGSDKGRATATAL